jgi:pyruvate kinase
VEAVKTMARIAESAEQDIDYPSRMKKYDGADKKEITTAIAYAACSAATDLEAAAIITVTMSGFTAESVSRFKPSCPIIGCSVENRVLRQLNLLWGVQPLAIEKKDTADELFTDAVREAKKAGFVKAGDVVVITAGVPLGIVGKTNMIHVVEVE